MTEEECYTYQCITTVVTFGIDDAAVSFATNDRTYAFHLRHDVYFAYRAGTILTTMLRRHVCQGTRTRHVTNRITRCMTQHIIGYADQCIFLAEHLSVLAYDGQSVHIRIYHKAHIRLAFFEQVAYLGQVLRQRFGVMREMSIRRAV